MILMPTAYLDNLIGKTWALSFKYKDIYPLDLLSDMKRATP